MMTTPAPTISGSQSGEKASQHSETRSQDATIADTMMDFDDIRPYNDSEVPAAIDHLINDAEFLHAVACLRYPRMARLLPGLFRWLVKRALSRQKHRLQTIREIQNIELQYMETMLQTASSGVSITGLDVLEDEGAYLFVSNHRDISMDPALVDYALYRSQRDTVRIAIGDNLLTKRFASDLMRLNKSFIVKRSAKSKREKLQASKHLSAYIHHSIVNDKSCIWIAQREGRAKDGIDKTNPAIISMFALNRDREKPFAEYIHCLNIVPVSISYEWDPCDEAKARELYYHDHEGEYAKQEHEDILNIGAGIEGQKGHVHLAFGDLAREDFSNAEDVTRYLDKQIIGNYVLHPSNCVAYERLFGEVPAVPVGAAGELWNPAKYQASREAFDARITAMDERWQSYAVAMYANPVKQTLAAMAAEAE